MLHCHYQHTYLKFKDPPVKDAQSIDRNHERDEISRIFLM